jgi:L-cysteine desulfidase
MKGKGDRAMFTLKEFLQKEVKPALGCTEPGAVALAVARACQELDDPRRISFIGVMVSDSIYKNGMAVGIPGANGAKGNAMAAALAAICGKAEYGLEVLKDCSPADVAAAAAWLKEQRVAIICNPEKHGVYIEATVATADHTVKCRIERDHSNIALVSKDEKIIYNNQPVQTDVTTATVPIAEQVAAMSYEELIGLADELDAQDEAFLLSGVQMNRRIAQYGLQETSVSGLSLGKTMQAMMASGRLVADLGNLIKSYCYAASDARMAGAQLPVMSSAGSGNHGITAILPIGIVGEKLGKSPRETAKALAISHLSTSFVKSKLGRLSAICGCAVAAGAGAAAGLTILLGGTISQAAMAMNTLLANTAGMLCDGAKESCTLKVGTGAIEAYLAALFALEGRGIDFPQGVVDVNLEKTTDNMGLINRDGMREMDQVMINILERRA